MNYHQPKPAVPVADVTLGTVENPRSSTGFSITVRCDDFKSSGGAYHRLLEDCNLLLLSPDPIPSGSTRTVNMDRIDFNPRRAPFDKKITGVKSRYVKLRKALIIVDLQPLVDALDQGTAPEPNKQQSIWG